MYINLIILMFQCFTVCVSKISKICTLNMHFLYVNCTSISVLKQYQVHVMIYFLK